MTASTPAPIGAFGDVVRRRRRALDLTQQQLAERVSCSEDMIRKIEADLRRPSRWLAERLLKHLQIDIAEQPAFLRAARIPRPADSSDAAVAASTSMALPLIGRASEWARWREALANARAGRGALVFVEGEPGIGKSHLARAALADAEASGFLTCATACYEIDRAIPLQPLIDWIDRLLDAIGPQILDTLPEAARAELAELSPQVRMLHPTLASVDGAPELRRTRIFNAFVQLVGAGLRRAPLLIVVDDVHWADDMTLALLHHLARQTRQRPLALLCAFRSEELVDHPALSAWLRSAGVEFGASRIALGRWSEEDVRALLAAQTRPVASSLAAQLYRNSDGYPLYVASMLQQLREFDLETTTVPASALALPPALRDSIRERVARLPAAPRAVLDVAAVLGRSVDFLTLERATHTTGAALADAIDLLVQRRLLREVDGGAVYDFDHDRIREVVHDDLGAARRIVLHRRAAEALIDGGADNAALIAEHWEAAQQWDGAVHQHERAAARALGLFALREAAQALERALAIADAHPAVADAQTRARLHERLGEVHAQDGRSAAAVRSFEAALAGARRLGDAAWTRDLLTRLGMAHRRADDYAHATECLQESLAASRALDEPQRVADTLYHLGTVAWSDGDNTRALRCHAEAIELCERHGLSGLVAVQAYHGDGEARFSAAQPQLAMARFERSLALARAIGERAYEAENLMMLGYCCSGRMGIADFARASAFARDGLAVAEAAEQEWHLTPLHILQAEAWRGGGRPRAAIALLQAEAARTEALDQTRFRIMALDLLGRLLIEQQRFAEAQDCFERARALGRERRVDFWRGQIVAGLAEAHACLGAAVDRAALRNAADLALARDERFVHARCLQVLAEHALRSDDRVAARTDAERLLALADAAGLREFAAQAHWLLGRSWLDEAPRRAEAELAQALVGARELDHAAFGVRVCDVLGPLYERGRKVRLAAETRASAHAWRTRLALDDDTPASAWPVTEEMR